MEAPHFLESARQQFLTYQSLGEKALAQLEENDLFVQPSGEGNSKKQQG